MRVFLPRYFPYSASPGQFHVFYKFFYEIFNFVAHNPGLIKLLFKTAGKRTRVVKRRMPVFNSPGKYRAPLARGGVADRENIIKGFAFFEKFIHAFSSAP